jgi:hypothetical protein
VKARTRGSGERDATYEIADDQMAAGSTFGAPKCALVIKATGAIEKFYSIEVGRQLFGTVMLHHWDERTGIPLPRRAGKFTIHPHCQEHFFELPNGVSVRENIFVLSGKPAGNRVDPPAAYYVVEMTNESNETVELGTYASAQLRGDTGHDVRTTYSRKYRALIAWNESDPRVVRLFGCSVQPTSFETTRDNNKASAAVFGGKLGNETIPISGDPVGMLHVRRTLKPGQRTAFHLVLSFGVEGRRSAQRVYGECPPADRALRRTRDYYREILGRAVVVTPDQDVNRGVLWAKANMLRTQSLAPTGWCLVNDPTRSNNSVARDTAWFAFGSDYITPEFSRESLMWYATHLKKNGMVVEYYDIRNGKSEDYGLNINDNTPLLILSLWHHYSATGDVVFLETVYPYATRAARYILSQRNRMGLVWCSSTATGERGIAGWRNAIQNYRLSGATAELNSECYAALQTISHMARVLKKHETAAEFKTYAQNLRDAINAHLLDPATGLYYLNVDLSGDPCTDVTSDLVFPVMFGVADDDTAAHIVGRLSVPEFWSEAGIRTVPRDDINYAPTRGHGLLGGIWVAVTFWYAFAASRFNPGFMSYALASSFRHYSQDPRRNNTVPGQFSEWLHGETLTNQGMMLSPWFPPRYLWAAIEGAGGLDHSTGNVDVKPRLPPDWKWLGVRNLPLAGNYRTWFVVRAPDPHVYANFRFERAVAYEAYDDDVTAHVHVSGEGAAAIALRRSEGIVIFVGNTTDRTVVTAVRLDLNLTGGYAAREYNSLRGEWLDMKAVDAGRLQRGIAIQLEDKGFCMLELSQET